MATGSQASSANDADRGTSMDGFDDDARSGEPNEAPGNETNGTAGADAQPTAGDTEGADAEDPANALAAQLEAARAEARRLEDRFLRARADYENLVRRTERERQDAQRAAAGRVAEAVVGPLEILERALLDFEAGGHDPRVRGIQMAVRQLRELLEREGLEPVPGVGAAFDHAVHEAVAREAADAPAGTIVEVVRSGYRLNGRLLRPALVKVSAGPGAHAAGGEEE